MSYCRNCKSIGTVIVLIDEYTDYPRLIVDNIKAALSDAGYGVLCVAGRELQSNSPDTAAYAVFNNVYKLAERCGAEGLISVSGSIGHSIDSLALADFLNRYTIPKVSLGIAVPGVPSVIVDDRNGMRSLMEHVLQDSSRNKFAFIRGYPNDPYSIRREHAFRETLLEHDRQVDESLFVEGNYDSFESYCAVVELLEKHPDIDTIVAANDLMALSAARAVTAKGLRIPQDVAVTGYDDTNEATQHSPALTTVRQPIEKLAEACVMLLFDAMEEASEPTPGQEFEVPPSRRVSNELIIRGSTVSESGSRTEIDNFSCESLNAWLQLSMSGLVFPPEIDISEISAAYWQTITNGSPALPECFEKLLGRSVAYEYGHWWNNLCYQLELLAPQILRQLQRPERMPHIQASLAMVRERVWSVGLDRQFELNRLENAQTSMQLQMSSCTESREILLVLEEWLKAIGATRSFLVRFESPAQNPDHWSQLIQVFRNGSAEPCTDMRFQSDKLLPVSLRKELMRGLLVMCPLYAGDCLFGYLMLDPAGMDSLDLETTANSIGNAMRSQHLVAELEKQARSLRSVNQELHNLARYDALTGLPNRLDFQQTLQNRCGRAADAGVALALLFLDLDGFKHVNDSLGHDAGDSLLQTVAQRLLSLVKRREQDGVYIARLGGDEFTIIVDLSVCDIEIESFGQTVLDTLSNPFSLGHQTVSVSGSVGCAMFPEDGTDARTLVKHADMAMYQAKQRGKNCLAVFETEMGAAEREFMRLDQDMKVSIDRGEFCLYFQPRIDLDTGRACGAEALLRWIVDSPDGPFIRANPNDFIPVAEATGFVTQLDQFVLEESCRLVRRWELAGTPFPLAVNISVVMLQQDFFIDLVADMLHRYKLDPNLLEFEITESDAMNDVESNVAKLTLLREMGIRISIDDFGTGYSSLSYLKKLPINCLKIDRSFVSDILSEHDGETVDVAIVRSVVALGKSMELQLVAEGVETQSQADLVRQMGCDQAQGFFFARPMPLVQLEPLINELYGSDLAA